MQDHCLKARKNDLGLPGHAFRSRISRLVGIRQFPGSSAQATSGLRGRVGGAHLPRMHVELQWLADYGKTE